jgi:hypothetical protein
MGVHLANVGRNTIDYIIGSPTIWQHATHLEVIINDTHYCTMGGDSDHKAVASMVEHQIVALLNTTYICNKFFFAWVQI